MRKNNLFVCYSLPLMLFLKENAINYDIEAKHKITDNPMWIYLKDDNLKLALDKWDEIKK